MTEQNQERIFSVLKKIKDVFGDQVNNCESLLIAQCLLEHEDKLADSVPISQTPPESRHTKCARRLPERTREPLSHSSSLAAEAEGDPFDRNVNYILDICHHQFDQHDDTGEGLDPVGVMDGAVLEWLTMYEGSIHDQNARSGTLEGAEAEGTPFPEDNRTPSEGSGAEDATPSNLSCTVSTTIQFGSTMDRYEEEGTPPREEEIVDYRDEGSLPGRDSPSARQETIGSASRRSDKWKHIPEPRRNMIRKGLQAMNRTNRTESPTASVSSLRILKVTGSTNTGINSMERAKLDSKGNLSFANSAANLIKSLEPTKSRFSTDPSTSDIPLNNSKRLSCTSVASGEEYDNSASIAQIHALARELCYDVYAELYARAVDDAHDEENDDDGQQNNHYPDEDTVPICSIVIQYLDPTGEKEDLFFVVGCDWPQWDYLTAGPLACECAPMPSSMDLFPTEDAYLGAQRHWRERHCLLYFLYPSNMDEPSSWEANSPDSNALEEYVAEAEYDMTDPVVVLKSLLGEAMRVWAMQDPHLIAMVHTMDDAEPAKVFHSLNFWQHWPEEVPPPPSRGERASIRSSNLNVPLLPGEALGDDDDEEDHVDE